MSHLDPRRFAFLGLLALLPVAGFFLARETVVWLSAVCVLLIVGSLYYLFGPAEAATARAT